MIQALFPNDAVFEDVIAPIHPAGTVLSWCEEHKGELQDPPWPAQSPDLYDTQPLWLILVTSLRNKFPPPTSLNQLENILLKE
jgi:hypothetical protein